MNAILLGIIGPWQLVILVVPVLLLMLLSFFIGWFAAKSKFKK